MKIIEQSINKLVCKLSDVIIATNKHTQNYLNRIVNDNEKSCVIPAAVDLRFFEKTKSDLDTDKLDCFEIGYVGRLSPEKNLETLLFAFKEFQSKIDTPCRLIIVGDGNSRIALKQLTRTLEIDKFVKFMGFQTNIQLFLCNFDILSSS